MKLVHPSLGALLAWRYAQLLTALPRRGTGGRAQVVRSGRRGRAAAHHAKRPEHLAISRLRLLATLPRRLAVPAFLSALPPLLRAPLCRGGGVGEAGAGAA